MSRLMINRRKAMMASIAALAFPLAGCDTGTTTSGATVAQILATIQNSCGFVTTAEAIIPVILSLLSTFNAAAGLGATVANNVAQQVVEAVCMAVKDKAPAPATLNAATSPGAVTVVVNGVPVTGHMVGPKTIKLKE
jgi:hypothetical protein